MAEVYPIEQKEGFAGEDLLTNQDPVAATENDKRKSINTLNKL